MKLEGEYVFDGPRERVWEIVRDPEILATALPGTQSLEQVGENEYAGKMHVRIGPVAGVFSGKIVVADEVPPETCTLTVEGRGAPGFANGTGYVELVELEEEKTLLKYQGEMQVGGRLASVGQRLIDSASRSMINQGLESLNNSLKADRKGAEEGAEVAYTPPSEARFAAAVAKDMARDMLPEARTLALVLAVASFFLLIGFWLGKRSSE